MDSRVARITAREWATSSVFSSKASFAWINSCSVGIIDVPTMSGVAIAARTRMNTDASSVLGRESREGKVIQIDEPVQQFAGRIELDGEPPFREVDLDFPRTFPQAVAHFCLMLSQQIIEKLLP